MREPVVKMIGLLFTAVACFIPFIMKSSNLHLDEREYLVAQTSSPINNIELVNRDRIEELRHSRILNSAHEQSSYSSVFESFTDYISLFASTTQTWNGGWADKILDSPKYFLNFEHRTGLAKGAFNYMAEIRKTWFMLEVLDDKYLDTPRYTISVNLKMSRFDRNSSTFTILANSGDEYFAFVQSQETAINQKTHLYFDLNFSLQIMNISSGQPLDLYSTYDPAYVQILYRIASVNLGVDISGALGAARPLQTSYWNTFLIFLISLMFLFTTMCTLNNGQMNFVLNVGFELMLCFTLFYYHLTCILFELAKFSTPYKVGFYFAGIFLALATFLLMVDSLHYLTVFGNINRGHEVWICITMTGFLFGLIWVAIATPTTIFNPRYKYYLAGFFIFPLLQILITIKRAVNRLLFLARYQGILWFNLAFGACMVRGFDVSVINFKPWTPLIWISFGSVILGAFFMFLQDKHGLLFFLPKSCIPGYIDMRVPIGKVPNEKLLDECPICYFPLGQDPEAMGESMIELQQRVQQAQQNQANQPNDPNQPNQPDQPNQPQEVPRPPVHNQNERQPEPLANAIPAQNIRTDAEPMLKRPDYLMKTPCNHYFHVICLSEWLRTKQACPMCSRVIQYFEG